MHETEVKYQIQFNEHRAECTCGWIGSYYESRILAEREAKTHEMEG